MKRNNMRALLGLLLPLLCVAGPIPSFYQRDDGPQETKLFNALHISAFNIQIFGQSKISDPQVVDILTDIIARDDMTLIQEIRDSEGTAIIYLLDQLNAKVGAGTYDMIISERLGSSSSKEQYCFFYKPAIFSVEHEYQYRIDYAMFERSPYIVTFNAPGYDVNQFAYLGIHVQPDDAVTEIDFLVDVYDEARTGSDPVPTDDWILGGDFNADCSYVSEPDWENIRLRQDPRFTWVIDDDEDTNLASSSCAYDRLVLTGRVATAYMAGTAGAFDFRDFYNLNDQLALDVSDHFPVVMQLD